LVTNTLAAPLGELRAASTAAGGTALTTTAQVIPFPAGTAYATVEGRNYTTAVVSKVALVPWLTILKTADLLATATDYSSEAQDADAATDVTLSSLDTFANGDAVYIGSHLPFRGVLCDVDAANGTASVLSADYWDGNSWEALTVTDGTASGGATFAVDGAITWTMPTDWATTPLADAVATTGAAVPHRRAQLYWARLKVSAALDSSTTLNSMYALARSTAYAELVTGRLLEFGITRGHGGVAGVEALTNAGTANLIVNVAAAAGSRGFA
jgi:hypothetical protein